MKKTKEQLIVDFKKSNKQRREKIATAAGFSTTDAYLASLTTTKKAAKISTPKKTSKKKDVLDYVVAFDTTGSMAAYINDVKKHVEKLIPEMFSKDIDLKMKIVAFGDYCDMTSKNVFGKAYQESQFTNDENHLQNFVKTAEDTSGGDTDEFYELVIKKITEETPWREGAKKTVLLIADYTPHEIGYSHGNRVENNQINWKEEAKKAAKKGISFDTLSILGMPWYKELSSITNGVNMPFKSANKMAEVVAASAYARGTSEKSRATFTASYASAVSSGDTELIGTYKTLSTLLDK
jgi:hypothetical protein